MPNTNEWNSALLLYAGRRHFQNADDHRLLFALQCDGARFQVAKVMSCQRRKFLCDQNLSRGRRALQPGRHIHRVTNRREVNNVVASQVSDKGWSRVDANANRQG